MSRRSHLLTMVRGEWGVRAEREQVDTYFPPEILTQRQNRER